MGRYLRIYRALLGFSWSRALSFRIDFFFRILMDMVFYAVHLAFFAIIYRFTPLLGGWREDQAFVFICGYLLVDSVFMTVFSNNLWWLPIFVNRGDLDYYLVRPVSSLFFMSLREFDASSFVNLLMALGLWLWSLGNCQDALTLGRFALYLLALCAGTFVSYSLNMLLILPVFWTHSARGLHELAYSFLKLGERPHQVYRGWLRWLVVAIVPVAFVASIPAEILFGDSPWQLLAASLGIVTLSGLAVVGAWRLALGAYTSASS